MNNQRWERWSKKYRIQLRNLIEACGSSFGGTTERLTLQVAGRPSLWLRNKSAQWATWKLESLWNFIEQVVPSADSIVERRWWLSVFLSQRNSSHVRWCCTTPCGNWCTPSEWKRCLPKALGWIPKHISICDVTVWHTDCAAELLSTNPSHFDKIVHDAAMQKLITWCSLLEVTSQNQGQFLLLLLS